MLRAYRQKSLDCAKKIFTAFCVLGGLQWRTELPHSLYRCHLLLVFSSSSGEREPFGNFLFITAAFLGSFLSGGWNLACTDAALVWEYFVLFTTIGYHEQTVLMVYGMGSYWNGWIGGTWSLQNAMAILG